MISSNRKTIGQLREVLDVSILFIFLLLAHSIVRDVNPRVLISSLRTESPVQVFVVTLAMALLWHHLLVTSGLYLSHRLSSYRQELADVAIGLLKTSIVTPFWLFFISYRLRADWEICLQTTVVFFILSLAAFASLRGVSRITTQFLRSHGRNSRNIVIIGTNHRAMDFARNLSANEKWGLVLKGFVDDAWHEPDIQLPDSYKLLCGLDDFPEILRTYAVDEVVISLKLASFCREIESIVSLCEMHGILVRSLSVSSAKYSGSALSPVPEERGTIILHDASWDEGPALIKRALDIVVAGGMLLVLSPVLLLIALLIKLTSPGPVMFAQVRLGRGKRHFMIYKFRTMVANAEGMMDCLRHLNETNGPTFKLTADPRITPLGKFLRKTSLDELPQLINVLIGDMSLVGPRPLPKRDYEGFSKDIHRRRFSVRPGITCLWQVKGRSAIPFEEWMTLDLNYIDQWSVWLDLKILAMTIPAVLRGSGAV